jgi:hypothetical protein
MNTLTVIDNQYATLVYHLDTKIVDHVFHKDLDTENFHLILNRGVELLIEHGAVKWLADTRAIGPFSEEQGQWLNEEWIPRAIASGWKYWALVVPEAIKARMDIFEHMSFFEGKGIWINVFTDADLAKDWLEKVDLKSSSLPSSG